MSFPKSDALRAVAATVPADRLLIETDSPYLAPVPHRGKRNEPALVVHVAEALAAARRTTPAAIVEQTAANFEALFGNEVATGRPCAEPLRRRALTPLLYLWSD